MLAYRQSTLHLIGLSFDVTVVPLKFCIILSEGVWQTSRMCQKASIQHSSQPRTNDPCVDPCVVLRLTLPLFPALDNQSIVCLSVSLPFFRSLPLICFWFPLVCILLFPSLSLSLSLVATIAICTSVSVF